MRQLLPKLARYAGVSAISTSVSLTVLGLLVATHAMAAGWANVVATGIGTVPSFELNRRWVWTRRGHRLIGRELLPFCTMSLAGLGLSTLVVSAAARAAGGAGWGTGRVTLVSDAANVAVFGSMWVVQYLVLDRSLFAPRASGGTVDGGMITA